MDVKIVFVTVAAVVFLLRHADIRNNAQNASFPSYSLENFLCGAPLNKFDDSFPPTWRNFPGVSAAELFNFITHPNVVEKWFSLVSLFTSADHKPLVVGKVFRAVV
uniref:Secreted protein n=2 Tax=Lutzomyia longipalpis TaxID=7200 RepID=A0A1B0C9S3_LUTLO